MRPEGWGVNQFISPSLSTVYDWGSRKRKEGTTMLKILMAMILGAALLLASAVWSGTVIEAQLVRLEPIPGADMGPVRFSP
jgi:hypothetical protein